MLLEQRVQDRINEAIDQAYLSFLITLIGYAALSEEDKRKASNLGLVQLNRPLLEALYQIARERGNESNRKPMKLRDLIAYAGLSGILPLTDAQVYTLEHAKREMYDAVENVREEYRKKIRQAILKINDEARANELSQMVTAQARQQRKVLLIATLSASLLKIVENLEDVFTKGATSALTNLINNATVDEVYTNALTSQLPASNVKAYKRVINDGKQCGWCVKFYQNKDGSPKVYSLSELIGNGSNDGLPKSAWKPVVGKTHVRCRCQLHYLVAGQEPPK
jgi:hypothetical protein